MESGKLAEDFAACVLKKHGYKILQRNFRSRFGEIDIIAKKNEYLVFVEVKYRKSTDYGGGAAAIDARKQERIRKTAAIYLRKIKPEPFVRFDVFILHGSFSDKSNLHFEIIEDAFY